MPIPRGSFVYILHGEHLGITGYVIRGCQDVYDLWIPHLQIVYTIHESNCRVLAIRYPDDWVIQY